MQSPAADPICESRNGGEIPPSKNVLSCRFWRPIITTRRGVEPRVHRSHSIEAAMNDTLRAEADEASTAAADLLAALADGHLAATVRGGCDRRGAVLRGAAQGCQVAAHGARDDAGQAVGDAF